MTLTNVQFQLGVDSSVRLLSSLFYLCLRRQDKGQRTSGRLASSAGQKEKGTERARKQARGNSLPAWMGYSRAYS